MFGRLNKSRQTPVNAILLQAAITIVFIVIGGGFRSLINFSVVASWSFFFLTVRLGAHGRHDLIYIFKGSGPCHTSCEGTNAGKVSRRNLVCYKVKVNLEVRPYKAWIVTPLVFCAVRFVLHPGVLID
jgi:hypothetical protein